MKTLILFLSLLSAGIVTTEAWANCCGMGCKMGCTCIGTFPCVTDNLTQPTIQGSEKKNRLAPLPGLAPTAIYHCSRK